MNDIVEENRKFWREITEDDGGESGQMQMLRELCDECDRLRAELSTRSAVMDTPPSLIERFLVKKASGCLATVKYAEDNADDWAGALPAESRQQLRHDAQQFQYAADCIATLVSTRSAVRAETIEECAKVADLAARDLNISRAWKCAVEIARAIRALSPPSGA